MKYIKMFEYFNPDGQEDSVRDSEQQPEFTSMSSQHSEATTKEELFAEIAEYNKVNPNAAIDIENLIIDASNKEFGTHVPDNYTAMAIEYDEQLQFFGSPMWDITNDKKMWDNYNKKNDYSDMFYIVWDFSKNPKDQEFKLGLFMSDLTDTGFRDAYFQNNQDATQYVIDNDIVSMLDEPR